MSVAGDDQARAGRSLAARLIERLRPLPTTNHVALGTFCHIASTLREVGLRRWTGPFDWIFSTPAMVTDCLDDGFVRFLDPAELESVEGADLTNGSKRQCRHRTFETRYRLPTIFNHHDPSRSAADRRAITRAITRMRNALAAGRRNQLYMMSEIRWPEAAIAALAGRLAAFPADNTLVVITATGGSAERTRRCVPVEGLGCPVIDVDLRTGTRSNGVAFPDPADEAHLAATLQELASAFEARPALPA